MSSSYALPTGSSMPHEIVLQNVGHGHRVRTSTAQASTLSPSRGSTGRRTQTMIIRIDYSHLLQGPSSDLLRWEPRQPDLHVLLAAADVGDESSILETLEGPELSAIIISRNDEARIARTVASVVNQSCSEPFRLS